MGRPIYHRSVLLASVVLVVLCVAACGSPVAPSARGPHAQLTVRVLEQGSHQPIPGVTVSQDGRARGLSDALGVIVVPVTVGQDTTVAVAKAGYTAVVPWVTAAPTGPEVWTFYLDGGH